MLLMLDSAEELALEGFVRGNRSTESFGRVGKRVFAETSEDSVVGWGFPEGVGGFLGEDLSVAEDPAAKEVSAEDTTGEAAAGEVFEEETAEEASEPGGWGEVFSQFRKDAGVVEETPGVSGMEFEDVEEVEDEDESEDTEDEEEEFEDVEEVEDEDVEDTEDEDEFEDVEEVEDEDEFEDTEDTEEDDPTEVVEFSLDGASSGGEEEEVEEGSTDESSVEEEPSGYSGGLEFEDVEEVDDDDEDTADVEDADEDTTEEEDANTSPSPVEVVRTPQPKEVSKPKKPAHKPRKRLSRQDAPSTSQEPHPTIREAKPKSQKGRLKKPSTNTHTFDTPKRSPGIRRLEPIPATVREYVMANPDVCYNDVVKLYSLKQIKKELALGRIYRSGNKLGV